MLRNGDAAPELNPTKVASGHRAAESNQRRHRRVMNTAQLGELVNVLEFDLFDFGRQAQTLIGGHPHFYLIIS